MQSSGIAMKIAYAYDVPYPWHVGGIEMLNYNEAKELAKEHDVHFFTMKWPSMKQADFTYSGVRYHAQHEVNQGKIYRHRRRSIREALLFSIGMYRLFWYDFDVVFTNMFPVLHLPVIKLYRLIKRPKIILEVAEVWDREYWVNYLGPVLGALASAYSNLLIRNFDAYVAISSTTAEKLEKCGIERGKIHLFVPCIDDKKINSIAKADYVQKKRIIFSGRFIKEKRLDKWLNIVKKVSGKISGVEAVLIGSGPEKNAISESISSLKLNGLVKLKPFYENQSDLYKNIKMSSLLLHMSEREGFGIVIVESIALGTPVVLPSYTPIPKEIRDMCLVEKEKDIPNAVIKIISSRDKSKFIRNKSGISKFFISRVNDFYGSLFKKLDLPDKGK